MIEAEHKEYCMFCHQNLFFVESTEESNVCDLCLSQLSKSDTANITNCNRCELKILYGRYPLGDLCESCEDYLYPNYYCYQCEDYGCTYCGL